MAALVQVEFRCDTHQCDAVEVCGSESKATTIRESDSFDVKEYPAVSWYPLPPGWSEEEGFGMMNHYCKRCTEQRRAARGY